MAKREASRATPLPTAHRTMRATYQPSGARAASVASASMACLTVHGMSSEKPVPSAKHTNPAAYRAR
jgi:hypothetical protein